MKKVILLLVSLCFLGVNLNAKVIRNVNFQKSKRLLKVYPASRKNLQKIESRGKSKYLVLSRPDGNGSLCSYMTFALPSDVNQLAVGLVYKSIIPENSNGRIYLRLNYNDKSKRNGSAGSKQITLAATNTWKEKTIMFNIPPKAVSCQLIFLPKQGACTLQMKSLKISSISDKLKIKKTSNGALLKSSPNGGNWKQSALLQGFYEMESAIPASVQTDVKLTYDSKNLYVAYIAYEPEMASINATIKERDGDIWKDDCVELFIFDKIKDCGWQFMVNSLGTQADYKLEQQNPGDPYKASKKWNGKWKTFVFKKKNKWEAVIIIPWSTIGFKDVNSGSLTLNFARERKVMLENSHWNAYQGRFNDLAKHSLMSFAFNKATITRFRQKGDVKYTIKRPQVKLSEVTTSESGNYIVGSWYSGVWKSSYPKAIREKNSSADFEKWRKNLMTVWGEAGMFGPDLRLIFIRNQSQFFKEFNQKFGMKCPYYLSSWNVNPIAKYLGGEYYIKTKKGIRFDVASPKYRKAFLKRIANFKNPGIPALRKLHDESFMSNKDMLLFWQGKDEPTNIIHLVYSRSNNKDITAALDKANNEVKEKTGFGKYGLPDYFAKPDKDTPFRRIAFRRWWNTNYTAMLKESRSALRKIKAVPYLGLNINTTAGLQGMVDFSEMTGYTEWVGCDPYPTATAATYGMARALFHTGFNVKLVTDLATKSRTVVMPQAFIYHGGKPSPADIREWASQALKNGAEIFFWYTMKAPMLDVPDVYTEMLRLNKYIGKMNKMRLPEKTNSAILFSDYDYWGLKDVPQHATYSIYSILGEHVKSWFKFISPLGVNRDLVKLPDYNTIYIPRMQFSDSEFTQTLIKYVKDGGSLVVFDPQALSHYIDGSNPTKERNELFGVTMKPKKYSGSLSYKKQRLPLSKIMNLSVPQAGTIAAWDFVKLPAGAKVIAKYSDGKAAALKRKLGKGSIIIFAAMPFGNSSTAVKPEGWKTFFTDTAKQAGEKCNRPIWNFMLPKPPKDSIKLNFNLKK
jgi:glycosyl hydrolase family 42 (putative beta-galactosidase)